MPDESLPSQPTPPDHPPLCEHCRTRESVSAVTISGVYPGVEYWQCLACGRVWGTRYGKPMKEAWA